MYGILDAVTTISTIINGLQSGEELNLDTLKKNIPLMSTKGRLTKLLSDFIIEPCIITTKGSANTAVFDKTIQLNTDIFAGFYMQAFQVLNEIYKVDVQTAVSLLSSKFNTTNITGESEPIKQFDILMSDKTLKLSDVKINNISLEDNGKIKTNDEKDSLVYGTYTRQMMISINVKYAKQDPVTGREQEDAHTINIPFTIKAHVVNTDIDNIIALIEPGNYKKGFFYRLDEYRSGAISLSDLLFCGDLIKEYKSNAKKDKAKLIDLINSRTITSNIKRGTNMDAKGVQGFEANYNMLILTSDEASRLEKILRGSLDNETKKETLLSSCAALCATVLDDDYERVSIYTADIRGVSSFGYKVIQKRKDNSNDMGEILKALFVNKPIGI